MPADRCRSDRSEPLVHVAVRIETPDLDRSRGAGFDGVELPERAAQRDRVIERDLRRCPISDGEHGHDPHARDDRGRYTRCEPDLDALVKHPSEVRGRLELDVMKEIARDAPIDRQPLSAA